MANTPCPACGAPTGCDFIENYRLEAYCTKCDWEEGGPSDFGFVSEAELDNRFMPLAAYEEPSHARC